MKWRCPVLSADAGVASCIAEALRADDDIDAPACDSLEALPECIDGVLVVAASGAEQRAREQIDALRGTRPSVVLMVAALGVGAEQIASLFEAGICDFVAWPCTAQELLARVRRSQGARTDGAAPSSSAATSGPLRDFVGSSPRFVQQMSKLPVFAACDAGVLIVGETGTGKEIFAQAVHYLSARAGRPWVAVNCGAIPTELIEDELFGHVRGAYTTAHAARPGLVREAEGGTLFLDDVDCLPLAAQSKLLRFLQEREYRAVGSNAVQHADVRVIAASNLQLSRLVERGQFRQDLFYRLNVLSLELPPLRERCDDIRALALHFTGRFAAQFGRPVTGLTPAALQALATHRWPGNVRELQHTIERAVLLAHGPLLTAADLALGGQDAAAPQPDSFHAAKSRVVRQFERDFIEQLLAQHGGNVTHAAQAAKKNRRAFFELMRKHRIEAQRFRAPAP